MPIQQGGRNILDVVNMRAQGQQNARMMLMGSHVMTADKGSVFSALFCLVYCKI